MLPRTFLTQLIPARIAEALRRVERMIWTPHRGYSIAVDCTESFRTHQTYAALDQDQFRALPAAKFCWGPMYSQRWFRLRITAPPPTSALYFRWNDQAEATLYVAGVPYAGLDLAHPKCRLPDDQNEFVIESVCIKTGIWLDGSAEPLGEEGSAYSPPELFLRNDLAWGVFHDLKVLLDVLEVEGNDYQPGARKEFTDPIRFSPAYTRASPLFRRWCAALDQAIDVFDREGLPALRLELEKSYQAYPAEKDSLRAILTGHAHVDLVWLWPEQVGTFKAVHSWATQVRLLEQYPEFHFGFSQPACYAAVADRAPRLHQRVEQLIAEGRWEATGASLVEFDTQLPCGEALLRGLRLGQAAFKKLRGTHATVCWLPDAFGYSGVLPQLLQGFGVTGFFTTKLSWNTINRLPHTSFRWKGPDGAEVDAHILHLHDYNEAVNVRNLREDALHHQQAPVHAEFLVPTGYGDGGGGPTEEMCERARRVQNLAGCPKTEWGTIERFFERLSKTRLGLPELTGELLFELHRGVFTTHGDLKASFRELERALQTLESAHSACGAGPIDEHFWQRLIFSQFHDYIPGSSIWEVYAEGIPELKALSQRATATCGQTLARGTMLPGLGVQPSLNTPALFNPLPISRSWTVNGTLYDLPPLFGAPLSELTPRALPPPLVRVDALESARVQARFGESGELVSLVIDGQKLALRNRGFELAAYPDHPAKFEAWDIDRASLVCAQKATISGRPECVQDGSTGAVAFTFQITPRSTAIVRYSITGDEPVLRITCDVEWNDPEMILKGIVSTHYLGREARFGAPYGSTLRNQWPGYQREEAQWEVPASRWLTLMDDAQSEGLSIVTESKYGFTVREGVAGVSLLRSALITGADDHQKIRETLDRPRHSDLGSHSIRLAITRHSFDLSAADQAASLADTIFTPCISYVGGVVSAGISAIHSASLIPAWADPTSPRVWVLRLHEVQGRRGIGNILLAAGWKARIVQMADTVSTVGGDWSAHALSIPYLPYQIVSVALLRPTSAPAESSDLPPLADDHHL